MCKDANKCFYSLFLKPNISGRVSGLFAASGTWFFFSPNLLLGSKSRYPTDNHQFKRGFCGTANSCLAAGLAQEGSRSLPGYVRGWWHQDAQGLDLYLLLQWNCHLPSPLESHTLTNAVGGRWQRDQTFQAVLCHRQRLAAAVWLNRAMCVAELELTVVPGPSLTQERASWTVPEFCGNSGSGWNPRWHRPECLPYFIYSRCEE